MFSTSAPFIDNIRALCIMNFLYPIEYCGGKITRLSSASHQRVVYRRLNLIMNLSYCRVMLVAC